MYFPIGWPKYLTIPQDKQTKIKHITCHRDKIIFAVITEDSVGIWFSKPCVQILSHRRSLESLELLGINCSAEWKADCSALATVTSKGNIIFYLLDIDLSKSKFLYEQRDSKVASLKRETAELFIKESIRPLTLTEALTVSISGGIASLSSVRDELVVTTRDGCLESLNWDGTLNFNYSFLLSTVSFSADQQHSRASAIEEDGVYVSDIEFCPILGGFSIVLSDGRAAFLSAPSLQLEPDQVQGIWAQEVQDATCTAVNHKYKLIAYGRKNAQVVVYCTDELTGELQIAQRLELSSKDFPDACEATGAVHVTKWTPDSCALAVAWEHGGLSVWSVFGALLVCSLGWDFGINRRINTSCCIETMEWGSEGYHLWIGTRDVCRRQVEGKDRDSDLIQLQFVKSTLTVNPCMSNQENVFLQGEDRLYVNAGDAVIKVFRHQSEPSSASDDDEVVMGEVGSFVHTSSRLIGNKQWIVIPIPYTYTGSNWPLRYSAIDSGGQFVAIAGKTGVAHYDVVCRKWKLFGNETQEKDFVVTGGLLWWRRYLVMGCYNFMGDKDEIRLYPRESKLDNTFACTVRVSGQVLALNQFRDKLIVFCANNRISLFGLTQKETNVVQITRLQDIDISNLGVHPACVASIALTSLRTETVRHSNKVAESILLNACGKLILIQRDMSHNEDIVDNYMSRFCTPTVLASCVENVWVSSASSREKQHLVDALWLGCGAHGLKVWLPLFPRESDRMHNFMSRRIMLPFHVHIYPLAVLFENAVILGAENDTVSYNSDPSNTRSSLPFNIVERTSQVYLHHILRQLLRRNLGFHAWEIARTCANLPYFPHSLELLLHEVLEEEATSKEPIPDALLPRVIEFIREFPVYLQTVVQCARKTEIALWRHLFTAVGDPKDLFQECMNKQQLTTAASYLIILQNMETAHVSRQHATILLDAALDRAKWELAKDLVRFLRAIDPSDVESPPRSSIGSASKYSLHHPQSPLIPSDEDLSFVLGSQVARIRTLSVTSAAKVSGSESSSVQQSSSKPITIKRKSISKDGTAEEFFIDVILQRHTRKLLGSCRLRDLGSFAAYLDIHLVKWLKKERCRAAKIEDFVTTLKKIHRDFQWPYPIAPQFTQTTRKTSDSCTIGETIVDCNMKPLSNRSTTLIGDSGYSSNNGPSTKLNTNHSSYDQIFNNDQTVEAQLRPRLVSDDDDGSLHTVELSEESSVWGGEGEFSFLDEGTWNGLRLDCNLEHLSQEVANKGPHQSEVQLRYLLQLMMEAGCLDYSLLISIVLRDAMAVVRTINASRVIDQEQDVPVRLREALLSIEQWTNKQCFGYKVFMQTIRGQLSVLNKIIWSKPSLKPNLESSILIDEQSTAVVSTSSSTNRVESTDNRRENVEDLTESTNNDLQSISPLSPPSSSSRMECAVS